MSLNSDNNSLTACCSTSPSWHVSCVGSNSTTYHFSSIWITFVIYLNETSRHVKDQSPFNSTFLPSQENFMVCYFQLVFTFPRRLSQSILKITSSPPSRKGRKSCWMRSPYSTKVKFLHFPNLFTLRLFPNITTNLASFTVTSTPPLLYPPQSYVTRKWKQRDVKRQKRKRKNIFFKKYKK